MTVVFRIAAIAVIFFIFSNSAYSQDSLKAPAKFTEGEIVDNYLAGVKAGNFGLKVSSAYYLGERKSTKAVIPLMEILKSDSSAEARIMAALSLFKIGDERGIYAIKRAIEFDSDDHVRRMCGILYQMYEVEQQMKKEESQPVEKE